MIVKYFGFAQYKQSLRSFQDLKQSGFALVLVILTVAIVAGYFVYINYSNLSRVILRDNRTETPSNGQNTQTSMPTTKPESTNSADMKDWKTYKNDTYQFSYPGEWILKEYPQVQTQLFSLGQDPIMLVGTFKNKTISTGMTFDDPVGTKRERFKGKVITKTDNLIIAGYKAFKTISEV